MTTKQTNKLSALAMEMHKNERAYSTADFIDFLISILIVLIAVLGLRLFIAEPIRVDGESMLPTLENNERMLVEKVSYWFNTPTRGDIIICYYPNRPGETFVKRVCGLPGETLQVKEGLLYINGSRYDESAYWDDIMTWYEYGPITIPDDCVFVMGDNRNHSGDSREHSVGPIPLNRIMGHVLGVIYPFNHMREVGDETDKASADKYAVNAVPDEFAFNKYTISTECLNETY